VVGHLETGRGRGDTEVWMNHRNAYLEEWLGTPVDGIEEGDTEVWMNHRNAYLEEWLVIWRW
jgi:hypothetical protein